MIRPRTERKTKQADWLTRARAYDLGDIIKKYWEDRGHKISLVLEPIYGGEHGTLYGIKSDMVNGLPR